jgi:bifunctional non-homologous end joining protein LigD
MPTLLQSGQLEKTSLYYRDNSSDKVYHAQIEEQAGRYVVNFQYGRRGSTLQAGTKTAVPVDYAKAVKIFEKLVQEKKAKGYTTGEDGTPFTGPDQSCITSGLLPQLLNPIDQAQLHSLLDDPAYIMQEKMDGVRLMVRASRGEVVGSNRKGLTIPISAAIEAGVKELVGNRQAVLDGEAIGDVYYVFDLLEIDGEDLRPHWTGARLLRLQYLFWPREGGPVRLVAVTRKPQHKQQAFADLKTAGAEGVVFKKCNAPYVPGRPSCGGDHLKFKFKASTTALVMGQNSGKRSVMISLMLDSAIGGPALVGVGSVTVPANYDVPAARSCVEIEYLYAYPGGSLFQPVYKGQRPDKDQPDLYSSLKFKQAVEEDDA